MKGLTQTVVAALVAVAATGCSRDDNSEPAGGKRLSQQDKSRLERQVRFAVANWPPASQCSQLFEVRDAFIADQVLGSTKGEIFTSVTVWPKRSYSGSEADLVSRRCFGVPRQGWVANIGQLVTQEFNILLADDYWQLGTRIDRPNAPVGADTAQ